MYNDRPLETHAIIKNFLAADLAKGVKYKSNLPTRKFFSQICDKIEKKNQKKLAEMVKDKIRLERFIRHRWFLQEIPLKYIGGWPKIGDLPKEWCWGSVVDSANQVANNIETNFDSIAQIKSMITIIDEILTFFPPILVPGGDIRDESRTLFFTL